MAPLSLRVSLTLGIYLLSFVSIVISQDSGQDSGCKALPLPAKTVFQFNQSGPWIENVAARRNGDILFTLAVPKAQVYLLQNPSSGSPKIKMIQEFPEINSLRGIAEPRPDVFVIAGGSVTSSRAPIKGSFGMYEIAFQNQSTMVSSRKIVDMPDAAFLNGVASFNDSNSVFVGDSMLGHVYRVDIKMNTYDVAVQLPEMAPVPGAKPAPFGINGMKIWDGSLTFDNSNDKSFYKVKLGADGISAAAGATAQKMATADDQTIFLDDFDIDTEGTIWATSGLGNTLLVVDGGKSQVAVGDPGSLTVAGPTAAVFGRNLSDKGLYVVTSGAQGLPVNGSVTEPAKVVRIDTSGFASCRTSSPGGGSTGSGESSSSSGTGKQNSAVTFGAVHVHFAILACSLLVSVLMFQ